MFVIINIMMTFTRLAVTCQEKQGCHCDLLTVTLVTGILTGHLLISGYVSDFGLRS